MPPLLQGHRVTLEGKFKHTFLFTLKKNHSEIDILRNKHKFLEMFPLSIAFSSYYDCKFFKTNFYPALISKIHIFCQNNFHEIPPTISYFN